MKRISMILLFAALVLASCEKTGQDLASHKEMNMPMDNHDHMDHGAAVGGSTAVDSKAVQTNWKLSVEKPQSGQNTMIDIQVLDSKGNPIENYDINHEQKMHLIVVSKDLSYFSHLHPEYKGKDSFEVSTSFPSGGDYKLIADFIPSGIGATTKTHWVSVQGQVEKTAPIEPDSNAVKTVDGKEFTFTSNPLTAGKEVSLTFHLKDGKTKKPITDLQPYLGAIGHVVIMSADTEQYLHVHPADEKSTGPDAVFMTTFPKSGLYKIWGQFQHEGKVSTVSYVVKVP